MADTKLGDFPDEKCSDCGGGEVIYKHWGPLVPAGEVGYFDGDCWKERRDYCRSNKEVPPLGYKSAKT